MKYTILLLCAIFCSVQSGKACLKERGPQQHIEENWSNIVAFLNEFQSATDLLKPLPIPFNSSGSKVPAIVYLIEKKRNMPLIEIIISKRLPLESANFLKTLFTLLARQGKSKVMGAIINLYKKYKLPICQLLNAQTPDLWTPLMFAAATSHTACVRLLINSGAQIDPINKDKQTALHLAVSEFNTNGKRKANKIVQLLCEAKANTTIKDEAGRTAFTLAHEYKFLEAARTIQCYEAKNILSQENNSYFNMLQPEVLLKTLNYYYQQPSTPIA